MRIGVFIECFVAGGLDMVIVNQLNAWPDKADEFVLIANESHPGVEAIHKPRIKANYRLQYMPAITFSDASDRLARSLPRVLVKALMLYGRYLLNLRNYYALARFFREQRLDAIIFHNGGMPGGDTERVGVLAARKAGIPRVVMVVHSMSFAARSMLKPLEDRFDAMVDRAARIVCVCEPVKVALLKLRNIRQNPQVIYNGATIGETPAPVPHEDFTIVTTASYDEYKGHRYLFEALALVAKKHKVRALVLGDGTAEQREVIRASVREHGVEDVVDLLGFRSDIAAHYARADAFVLPSLHEGFPMSIIEAMSSGLPIVATDVGGVRELLDGGSCGLVVPSHSGPALAQAIESLISDRALRRDLGAKSKRRFEEHYTAAAMSRRYHEVLRGGVIVP